VIIWSAVASNSVNSIIKADDYLTKKLKRPPKVGQYGRNKALRPNRLQPRQQKLQWTIACSAIICYTVHQSKNKGDADDDYTQEDIDWCCIIRS
jgi:hypothetical protein